MYSEAVKIANENQPQIAHRAAQLIKQANIPFYSQLELDDLAKRVLPAFHLRLNYLETNNLTEWREYCANLTKQRDNQGVHYSSIIAAGDCITQAIMEFFRAELPKEGKLKNNGLTVEKVLELLEKRMNGLTMVGVSVVVNTGIRQEVQKKPGA